MNRYIAIFMIFFASQLSGDLLEAPKVQAEANVTKKISSEVEPYVAVYSLYENLYEDKEQKKMGVGVSLNPNEKLNLVIAYEGDVLQNGFEEMNLNPYESTKNYLNGGSISYKLTYKF